MTTVTTARPVAVRPPAHTAWRERSARLYEELERPSRALVRRAFRGAFTDDEVEDIYSNAWVGTLRALERRHEELDDEEIRKYVLTAVAHHASKEIRRRKRRPVSPLDGVHAVPDDSLLPDETAAQREQSRVARDVLSSLPPRRRAVMLLRYGWGLEPKQVCRLVKGLSPRAYRKEITRGVDELAAKLRRVETGEWCSDREPLLKAYASGLADAEQRRQAQQHLSHCRQCSDFVGKLSSNLHDIGSAAAIPTAADAIHDGHLSVLDRAADLMHRAKDSAVGAFGRNAGDGGPQEATAQTMTASGGARGAGAAGTGALAKLAGTGAAGKLTAICLSGGVAATACLATGVVPTRLPDLGGGGAPKPVATAGKIGHPPHAQTARFGAPYDVADEPPPDPEPAPPTTTTSTVATPPPTTTTTPVYTTTTTPAPVAPSTPPTQQEYGVASAATPTSGSSSSSSGGGGGSAVEQEFGP